MSSEGSPRLIWRCPADLLEQIEADIALSLQTRRGEPWTTTAYIKAAIVEFLRKRRASRDRSKRGQSLKRRLADYLERLGVQVSDQAEDGVDVGAPLETEPLTDKERGALYELATAEANFFAAQLEAGKLCDSRVGRVPLGKRP
jgi:hypothetical protein